MTIRQNNPSEKPESWISTSIALGLFVITGLNLVLSRLPHRWAITGSPAMLSVRIVLYVFPYVFDSTIFFIGWINNFPRWSYPYLVHIVIVGIHLQSYYSITYLFRHKNGWLDDWHIWIPFIITCVVALLVTRSLQPIKKFFANIQNDWTVLTFGMSGSLFPLIDQLFGELRGDLLTFLALVILAVLVLATVIIYMRMPTQEIRILTLLAGIFLVFLGIRVGLRGAWQGEYAAILIVYYGIMFSPALIGEYQKRHSR